MGWRDSYNALLELFPQVDSRLIKGAALEHGDDVASAAEFILSEVLTPDDVNVSDEQQRSAASNYSPEVAEQSYVSSQDQSVAAASDGDQSVAATSFNSNAGEFVVVEGESAGWSLSRGFISDLADTSFEGNTCADALPNRMKQDELDLTVDTCQSAAPIPLDTESGQEFVHGNQEQLEWSSNNERQEMLEEQLGVKWDTEGVGVARGSLDLHDKLEELEGESGCVPRVVVQEEINLLDASEVPLREAILDVQIEVEVSESPDTIGAEEGTSQWSESGFANTLSQVLGRLEERSNVLDTEGSGLPADSFYEGSVVTALEALNIKESYTREYDELEQLVAENALMSPFPPCENETATDGCLDSMLSIEKSFTTVDGMDGADWESVYCSPVNMTSMETLDELVEEAKSGKEVLITAIQEIRALRLKTDQAEYSARQAKDEAARGGLDVMAKVDEMRQMLARAQEANAVHAGEVYGEKAVLATEARELRSRLVQVKAEKGKALSVLNEIKASLQARINNAIHEREVAEHEKAAKEIVAREVLVKEEALVAKVAQESRDLDTQAEACTKLRESLIEHGSIVDALQGEVAVLCEDAEALKKDLDGMLLSCSGGFVHMLSRTGNDTYNSFASTRSGNGKFSELNGQTSENLVHNEGGALSGGSDPGLVSHRVPAVQKAVGDKKSWSPLPSLLRSLSGSQELSSSSHSLHSSAASNSVSNSRIAVKNVGNFIDGSQLELGAEALADDSKYPTSPNSPDVVTQAERELYEAQMALFPGQESQLEYSSNHNLDIFRSEKPAGLTGGTDDEDWHLLDPVTPSKGSSGSSCSSGTGK